MRLVGVEPAGLTTLSAIDRLGAAYARLVRRGVLPLPASVHLFLAQVGHMRGLVLESAQRERLLEDRLAFLLARILINRLLKAQGLRAVHRWLGAVEVAGLDLVAQARAAGRGAVLATAHFGFPPLIRPIVAAMGIMPLLASTERQYVNDVPLRGDVWTRAQGLHRLRAELARGGVIIALPDVSSPRALAVPFFQEEIDISLGAFSLARRAGCPLLPFFAVREAGAPRFRLEFFPALPVTGEAALPLAAARTFAQLYESHAARHPALLDGYQPLFAGGHPPFIRSPAPERG